MRRAVLAGGAEVRFLRLAEPGGQLREPRGSALVLPPGAAAAGAAWSPDGHLLALATQVPSGARCAGAALRQGTGSCMLTAAPVWSCQKRGSVRPLGHSPAAHLPHHRPPHVRIIASTAATEPELRYPRLVVNLSLLCAQDGCLRVYLAALPALAAAHGDRVACLSALREVTVSCLTAPGEDDMSASCLGGSAEAGAAAAAAGSAAGGADAWVGVARGCGNGGGGEGFRFRVLATVGLPAEPALLALGPAHLAAAAGDQARPILVCACWLILVVKVA